MIEQEERLRILALAIRKGIDIRGHEAVSILEEAAEYIGFVHAWMEEEDAEFMEEVVQETGSGGRDRLVGAAGSEARGAGERIRSTQEGEA